jgi:hypothetical protein
MARIVVRPETDLQGAAAALTEAHATDGYPVEGVTDAEGWLRSDDVMAAWVAEAEGKFAEHAASLWRARSDDDQDHVAVLALLFLVKRFQRASDG